MFLHLIRHLSHLRYRNFNDRYFHTPVLFRTKSKRRQDQFTVLHVTMVLFTWVTYRATNNVANGISFRSPIIQILSQDISHTRVNFPTISHVVATVFRRLSREDPSRNVIYSHGLASTIVIPIECIRRAIFTINHLVLLRHPINSAITNNVHPNSRTTAEQKASATNVNLNRRSSLTNRTFRIKHLMSFIVVHLFYPRERKDIFPSRVIGRGRSSIQPLNELINYLRVSYLRDKRSCWERWSSFIRLIYIFQFVFL